MVLGFMNNPFELMLAGPIFLIYIGIPLCFLYLAFRFVRAYERKVDILEAERKSRETGEKR